MPRPKGIITVSSLIEHAFDCDAECVEHAEALVLNETLVADMEKLANEGPDSSTKHAGSFEAAEQTKEVLSGIHPGYSCKEGRIVEDGLLVEFPYTPTRTRSVYSY
jgi:hypothetical protein